MPRRDLPDTGVNGANHDAQSEVMAGATHAIMPVLSEPQKVSVPDEGDRLWDPLGIPAGFAPIGNQQLPKIVHIPSEQMAIASLKLTQPTWSAPITGPERDHPGTGTGIKAPA